MPGSLLLEYAENSKVSCTKLWKRVYPVDYMQNPASTVSPGASLTLHNIQPRCWLQPIERALLTGSALYGELAAAGGEYRRWRRDARQNSGVLYRRGLRLCDWGNAVIQQAADFEQEFVCGTIEFFKLPAIDNTFHGFGCVT